MPLETSFTMDTSSIKFGPGVTAEVGSDFHLLGCSNVLIVTDAVVSRLPVLGIAAESLQSADIQTTVFSDVRIEPTDRSFQDAIEFAVNGNFDGFLAIGGGSVIDTAKAANLYSTWPADLLTYVNAPIGKGLPIPGKLKPLIAVPTTAGTGSETTGVAIFDLEALHAKTGIAHRALRPTLGVLDPDNTLSMPPLVTACSALDVLSHAIESFTALPFDARESAATSGARPAYQGANPISDIWASKAMEMVATHIGRVIHSPDDGEARGQMMLAAAYAGIGFGNAGVHLPHGMSYPVSGMARDYFPTGYPTDHSMIPHGMSVILNAPAVFRFTASADPTRHIEAARLLGANVDGVPERDAGDLLAERLIEIMQQTGMPNGLSAVGFGPKDIDRLIEGTLPQHRVTKLSPRPAGRAELHEIFSDAMRYW